MRMVSKKFVPNLCLAVILALASTPAFSASPYITMIDAAYAPGKGVQVSCSSGDQKKDQKCLSTCMTEVQNQQKKVDAALAKAQGKDGAIVAGGTGATSGAATALAPKSSARNSMGADNAVKNAGKEASQAQAENARSLVGPMETCKSNIEEKCKESDVGDPAASTAKEVADACKKGADAAKQAAAQKDADAQNMAKDEKKDEGNGKGMEMPKMPEMPKKEDKPESSISSNTATNTATKVADSALSGNQLTQNKVGIGGSDDAKKDGQSSLPSYHSPGGFDSGISSSKGSDFAAGNGGAKSSTGSSSMGSIGGGGLGGSSESGGSGSAAASAPALPKEPEIEAFSNGSARPSYLGMKSKGGELADLGLEGGAAGAAGDHGAGEGDRTLASTDQNAGIHTEDNAGSLFNMVHERLLERGRSGGI